MAGSPTVEEIQKNRELAKRLRGQSMDMADIEFQMEVAPRLGYKGEIDPSIARYHPTPNDAELNLKGYLVDENDEGGEYRSGTIDGENFSLPSEPGTVNTVGPEAANPRVWAHEYRHKQNPDQSEQMVRAMDYFRAQNPRERKEALRSYAESIGATLEQAEDRLSRFKLRGK